MEVDSILMQLTMIPDDDDDAMRTMTVLLLLLLLMMMMMMMMMMMIHLNLEGLVYMLRNLDMFTLDRAT